MASRDPTAALKALVAAAKTNNAASMKKIADFWNTGFDFTQLPTDKSLYLSSGAYLLTDFKKDQYMTFTANPAYTWGPEAQHQDDHLRIPARCDCRRPGHPER